MTTPPGDRIELRGLRLVGRVGVLDLDLTRAGLSDDLADTVDYGAVCATVAGGVGAGHVALLERLAARVADAVLAADERIAAVDLTVRKLRPPVPADLATSGVHIARERG